MKGALTPRRCCLSIAGYVALALLVVAIAPLIGAERIELANVRDDLIGSREWTADTRILVNHRLSRVLLGFLAGGTLALVGSVFQVVLRNPLASPTTLGVTGGGALGAVLAIYVPHLAIRAGPFSSVQVFSLLGSAIVLGLIWLIAKRPIGLSMHSLLLAGVTIGILCTALSGMIRYLARPEVLVTMEHWTMGGVAVVGYGEIAATLPMLCVGTVLLFMQMPALNHLALGDEMALGHGIDVGSVQRLSFVGAGVATAGVVSVVGPIGFIGLLVPHAVRRLSGFDHRIVLCGSFLAGGALLVLCDAVARTIVAPTEIPVGIITTVVGAPFFIYLLVGRSRGTG